MFIRVEIHGNDDAADVGTDVLVASRVDDEGAGAGEGDEE
jgi:hypothetical protein